MQVCRTAFGRHEIRVGALLVVLTSWPAFGQLQSSAGAAEPPQHHCTDLSGSHEVPCPTQGGSGSGTAPAAAPDSKIPPGSGVPGDSLSSAESAGSNDVTRRGIRPG